MLFTLSIEFGNARGTTINKDVLTILNNSCSHCESSQLGGYFSMATVTYVFNLPQSLTSQPTSQGSETSLNQFALHFQHTTYSLIVQNKLKEPKPTFSTGIPTKLRITEFEFMYYYHGLLVPPSLSANANLSMELGQLSRVQSSRSDFRVRERLLR